MKLCKDCKWAVPYKGFLIKVWKYAKCSHPKGAVDPVEGDGEYCEFARREYMFCGPKGKYWEPKK